MFRRRTTDHLYDLKLKFNTETKKSCGIDPQSQIPIEFAKNDRSRFIIEMNDKK